MVVASLTYGALVGVLLSGAFVYWEVGRYAAPQVPVSRFDERKEMFAYTAGLFVGVPLAVAFVLFRLEIASGSLLGGLALLAALVAGTELAQRLLARSRFWAGPPLPFYVLGFRAAVGGILALAIVAEYFGGTARPDLDLAAAFAAAVAVVALEVAGALLSLPAAAYPGRRGGGPLSGGLFGAFGFLLLGLGPLAGSLTALLAAGLLVAGAFSVYRRLRPLLADVPAPEAAPPLPAAPRAYGRTDREAAGEAKPPR